jgi:hypothetical protein
MLKTTLFSRVLFLCAVSLAAYGQDRHDWQSLARLHSGDRIRLSLKTGRVSGTFQTWTPQGVTVGTATEKREDVLKIERYGSGRSRAKRAAIAAAIGFGGGFAAGASVRFYGTSRAQGGAIVGSTGAVIGALIFLLIPDSKEIIYSTR